MMDFIVSGHVHWLWCLAAFGIGGTFGFVAFVLTSAMQDHEYPEIEDGELYQGPEISAHWKSKTGR